MFNKTHEWKRENLKNGIRHTIENGENRIEIVETNDPSKSVFVKLQNKAGTTPAGGPSDEYQTKLSYDVHFTPKGKHNRTDYYLGGISSPEMTAPNKKRFIDFAQNALNALKNSKPDQNEPKHAAELAKLHALLDPHKRAIIDQGLKSNPKHA